MSAINNDFNKDFLSALEGKGPAIDLPALIIGQVVVTAKRRKTEAKKVNVVVGIYVGLTVITLCVLFFLTRPPGAVAILHWPDKRLIVFATPELIFYSKLAFAAFLFSIVTFGAFFINRSPQFNTEQKQ